MCLSEVCLPASVLSSWRARTCLSSLWVQNETGLLFAPWNKQFKLRQAHTNISRPRINECSLKEHQEVNLSRRTGPFLLSRWTNVCFLSCDFDGKHLKVRTPSLVTHLTRACVPHRVITEREKDKKCGPQTRKKGDSLFSHSYLLSSSSILSYRGFPSACNLHFLSLTFLEFVL